MTTRITVTTGDGGLVERNAQQQAAARQASLVKAQADKAAALGESQLRQQRIAQGRDPATGLLLPSPSSRLRRLDQQPAAFRTTSSDTIIALPSNITAILPDDEGDYYINGPLNANKPVSYAYYGSQVAGNLVTAPEVLSGGQFGLAYLFGTPEDGRSRFELIFPSDGTGEFFWRPFPSANRSINSFTVETSFRRFSTASKNCSLHMDLVTNAVSYAFNASIENDTLNLASYKTGEGTHSTLANLNIDISPLTSAGWNQAALILSTNNLSFYWNGSLVATAAPSEVIPVASYSYIATSVIGSTGEDPFADPGFSWGWAGTRVTSRARYRGNYTPGPLNVL